MEDPLWIDSHRPSIEEFRQEEVRERLEMSTNSALNLFIYGPKGVGKTAAAKAVAREIHDDPENDVVTINVADFFNRTKKEIREDPRFKRFLKGQTEFSKQFLRGSNRNKYKRNWSKRDMIAHIIDEYAAIPPTSSDYKTLILDNSEELREDFQQALRRIMERHYASTHFIFTSRSAGGIIPAIKSRCLPVSIPRPSTPEVVSILNDIASREEIEFTESGLHSLSVRGNGNVRESVLSLQTVATQADEVTTETVNEILEDIGHQSEAKKVLGNAEKGDLYEARKVVDTLLDDEGFSGGDVLELLSSVAHDRYNSETLASIVDIAAEVDLRLAESDRERIQIMYFVSEVAAET